jgi:hypothetical protein
LLQSEASWLFVVLSNKALTSPLKFSVGWSPATAPGGPWMLPIRLTMMPKHFDVYEINFGNDFASVQPVIAPAGPAPTSPEH